MPAYYLFLSILFPIIVLSATVGFAKSLALLTQENSLSRAIATVFSIWILICLVDISIFNIPGLTLTYCYAFAGNIFTFIHLFKKRFSHPQSSSLILISFLFVWFLVTSYVYFQFPDLNCDDDLTVYLRHIKMFIDAGNLDDAFSYRRLASYSGQTFFTALFVGGLPTYISTVFELGIVNPLIAYFIFEECKKNLSTGKSLLLSLSFLLIPQFRLNIASQSTAIYFSLASLFFLNEFILKLEKKSFRLFMLSLFALLSLRNSFILPFAALTFFALYTQYKNKLLSSFKLDWLCFAFILCLYGYSSYRSSQTVFFPLFSGNFNLDYGLLKNEYSERFFVQHFIQALSWSDILTVLFCLLYLVADLKRNRLLIYTGLTAITLILATTYSLRALLIPWHIGRYTEGFCFAFIILTFVRFLSDGTSKVLQKMSLAAAALILFSNTPGYLTTLWIQNFSIEKFDTSFLSGQLERENFYRNLLAKYPSGTSFLSMLNDPYLLDYSEHKIENLEIIGLASPNNKFDALGRTEDIDLYFRSLGADAFIFQDLSTTTCHYNPEIYKNLVRSNLYKKVNGRYVLKQDSINIMLPSVVSYTPYFLNFFDYLKSIEKLSSKEKNIYTYNLKNK